MSHAPKTSKASRILTAATLAAATQSDEDVVTFGTDAIQIYSVLIYLVTSPYVITFDGQPYSERIAKQSYPLLTCDLGDYGSIGVPPLHLTRWIQFDAPLHLLKEHVGGMKSLAFLSSSQPDDPNA